MALYKYFSSNLQSVPPSIEEEVDQEASDEPEVKKKNPKGPYNGYTPKQQADIGK